MARLAFGVLALLALAGTARAAQLRVLNEAEHPAFNYIYAANIYNPEDVIQEKFLSFEPDSVNDCAAMCNRTIGAMCKSWTFCWSSGRCATMAKAPASTTVRADGKSTYTPKCASGIKRGVPARNPAAEEDYITLRYGNECNMPIIAAVHFKNLDGDWVTNGWFALAPGQTKDVARTRNTVFYSYANEKGDPRCTRGCWDGMDTVEKFDGRTWGFREQAVSEDTELGDSYRLAFTCDNGGAAAPAGAVPAGAVVTSSAPGAAAPDGAGAADGSVTAAPEDGAAPAAAAPEVVSYVHPNGAAPNLRPIEPAPDAVFIREFGLAPRGGAASDGSKPESEADEASSSDDEVLSLGGAPAGAAEGEDEDDSAEDSTTIVLGGPAATAAAPAATAAAPATTAAAPAATAAAPAAPASTPAVLDAAAAARALSAPAAAANATAPAAAAAAPVLTAETAPAAGVAVRVSVNGTGVAVGVGAGAAAEEPQPADEFAAEPKRR